ncbi:hypothetical protein, partial [Granulosicoccus sp. 3-233]|uniref:hypothetical protein n=1 Tax=Granulosicoccus sp. 3-233 TaxID=3417969 RepID=UPI003D32C6E3
MSLTLISANFPQVVVQLLQQETVRYSFVTQVFLDETSLHTHRTAVRGDLFHVKKSVRQTASFARVGNTQGIVGQVSKHDGAAKAVGCFPMGQGNLTIALCKTRLFARRHAGTQARRHAGTQARRHAGTQARRHAGT